MFYKPSCYRVYVLRLWQDQAASPERAAVWRFMLEDPMTGQRRGFDGLDSLSAFLLAEIEATQPIPEGRIDQEEIHPATHN